MGYIQVRGARVHNLRGVDADIPRDSLVAFTGISGSGKSSLAFGTIYAESQHRYLESVAPYARRLLAQLPVPEVDEITGLPPAVALTQRRTSPSARSTVGTLSRISNSLRMLMSRAGNNNPQRLDSDSFSPNTVAGACPECHGQGQIHQVTEASLVPDPAKSIADGAIASWPGAWQGKNLRDILATLGYDIHKPWRDLDQADRDWILFTDDQPVVTVHPVREPGRIQRPYQGTYSSARRLLLKTYASDSGRQRAERFMTSAICPVCRGRKLRPESLKVTFAGKNVAELAAMPMTALADVLGPHTSDTGPAGPLTRDITDRIGVLAELGLGYLSIARPGPTLSAGELQRIRLATQLHAGLFGVVYVLDEPSAGLHPADSAALTGILRRLRDGGNTVCFVEHDMAIVREADWIVDVGPFAGTGGGQVLYARARPACWRRSRRRLAKSTAWYGWTSSPSAGRHAPIWLLTPGCSTPCAGSSPPPRARKPTDTTGRGFRSTLLAEGARRARAKAGSRWNCCSCPAPTHRAQSATARATTPTPCG